VVAIRTAATWHTRTASEFLGWLRTTCYRQGNKRVPKRLWACSHRPNKNLAIANRSRVSCAHNTSRAFIGLNITPWPWNLD